MQMRMRCHHHQMNTKNHTIIKFRKTRFSFTHLNLFLNFMALNFNSHSHTSSSSSSSSSWLLLLLFTLLSIFHTSLCLSQPTESPQNIETFYPIGAQTPSSPPSSPELLGPPPPPPPAAAPGSSSKGKIWKAVAATFAATLVVSGLIFFIVQRCLRSKRRKEEVVIVPESNNVVNNNNGFERIEGNVKGLIVDENGLDVVYWRKIQGRNPSRSLKREIFRRLAKKKDHQEGKEKGEEEEDDDENGRKKGKKSDIVQEFPLLRGQSSSSHMNITSEEDEANRITRKIPSLPTIHAPPSSARSSGSSFVFPTNERKSREESSSARKNPASGPAPPPSSTSSSSNGVVKLKPLHRDKANTSNADHKNDSGSALRVDPEFMEALFGYVATRRSPKGKLESVSPQRDTSSSG